MKTITKKITATMVSAVISLTAAATFTTPDATVLAYTDPVYSSDYGYELRQFEEAKAEGIRLIQSVATEHDPKTISVVIAYTRSINNMRYDYSMSLEENINRVVGFANNATIYVRYSVEAYKVQDYKNYRLFFLYRMADSQEEIEYVDSVAYEMSFINYEPGMNIRTLEDQIDEIADTAEAELR